MLASLFRIIEVSPKDEMEVSDQLIKARMQTEAKVEGGNQLVKVSEASPEEEMKPTYPPVEEVLVLGQGSV